jgi:hypothetical protein
MEEHEVQELVNELLKKKTAERLRKFRLMFFTFLGIAYTLFWAWTENPSNEAPFWALDLADLGILFIPGFFLLAFLNSKEWKNHSKGTGSF